MLRTLIVSLFLISHGLFAQVDFERQYLNGKDLFDKGKYNLAMESFKPLIPYSQGNQYSEYASFYYAMAAYHQGYNAVAKDMLNQIKKVHANWDKIHDVDFLLARVHFSNGDYFQGLKVLSNIQDSKFEKDIENLKIVALAKIEDAETLRMMHEEYPKDVVVSRTLAIALSKDLGDEQNRVQLDKLIDDFKFKKTDFIAEAPKTFYKEKYSVSLMLPFGLTSLEPTPGRKRNQIVLDFYEGMKLAVDTLSKQGINISLRAYDTERNLEKIRKLLETEEFKKTDLIVGPLFPEENKVVQVFAQQNRINIFHPFSNNTEMREDNPYGFLFQPAAETMGRKSADYLFDSSRGKKTMVFHGTGKKDSTLAASYVQQAQAKGMKVLSVEKIANSKETMRIGEILATPTEFDEFKYPSQFTLPKDSLHSIFVASDDPLLYTKVVGAVEMRGDSIRVIGSENWLDDNAIDLEKYQTLKITLVAPNFWDKSNQHLIAFNHSFLRRYGRVASNIARMGYEFMMFSGNQLKKNGVYFQDALQSGDILPGYLSQGFDFRFTRDNQLIPFTTFKKGELVLIEKR